MSVFRRAIPLFLLSLLLVGSPATAGEELLNFQENAKLPALSLPEVASGKTVKVETASGKPSLIMFFSLTPPFREERSLKLAATMNTLRETFKDRVNFAALYADDQGNTEMVKKHIAERRIAVPVLDDTKHQAYSLYGIFMTPIVLLISGDGKLEAVLPQTADIDSILTNHLKFLLGEMSKEQLQESLKPPKNVTKSPQEMEYIRRVNYGRVMASRKQLAAAQREFMTAAKILPKNIEAHIGLGQVLLASEQIAQAEQSFRQALEIDKESDEALAGLGLVLFKNKNYDKAIPILENALLSPEPQVEVILALAEHYESNALLDKAIRLNKLAVSKLLKRLQQ